MALQQTVYQFTGFGVPGEIFQDVPWVVLPYSVQSSGTPNIVGATAYTITSDGVCQAGNGGTLGFAGILADPKSYALYGTSGGALQPTLQIPDSTIASLLTQGMMIVTLPNTANIGDYVIYDDTTGELASFPPGPTCPTGFSFANAVVSQFTASPLVSETTLAVIQVSTVINPVPANA